MPQILRPQIQPQLNQAQISTNAAADVNAGLQSIGAAVRDVGRAFSNPNKVSVGAQLSATVSQLSFKMFEANKKASQMGVVSNALSESTLAFQKAQQERIQQVTDEDGNPLFSSLVDDIGSIGREISKETLSKMKDIEAKPIFQEKFNNFVVNQQILGLNKARQQQIDFGRAALDNGLGALATQGELDNFSNVGSYVNQGIDLLNTALQSGLISSTEHNARTEDYISTVREASLANTVRTNRVEATKLLNRSAESLGIDGEQHERLTSANNAARVSDQIQAKKSVDLHNADAEAQKAETAQTLGMRIDADALREDELILQEDNLTPHSYSNLKSKMKKRSAEFAKERESLQEVSDIIANDGDLTQTSAAKVDNHYNFQVENAAIKNNNPLNLQQKAEIATQYPGKVNTFARELNGTLQHGNPQEAVDAVLAYTFIRDRNAMALDGDIFTSKSSQIAESATLLSQNGGLPMPEALDLVRDRINNSTADLRKESNAAFSSLKNFKLGELNNTVAKAVGARIGIPFFHINYDIDKEAENTFKKFARENFLINNDESMAKESAANMMKFRYGISEVNGGKTYMQAPPEKIFNLPTKIIRQQLDEDVAAILPSNATSAADVNIRADTLTRGSFVNGPNGLVENITYLVSYIDKVSGNELHLLKENGELKRWKPDTSKGVDTQKKEFIESAKEKRETREKVRGRIGTDIFREDIS